MLFFIYMLVALVNAVLTNRLRRQEARVRDKEEKEKTIQLYNTLLSSLSHELKTPIATIIGAVDTLREAGDKITAEQKGELLAAIDIAGSRLNKQVENLLNMSRLETGTLALKRDWCDINELIFRVMGSIPDHGDHKILFEPDEKAPLFRIDEGLMEIVLYGIMGNAVRYTAPGSEVRIRVGFDDDRLHITVSDNGKGIPEAE
ncbi:MAG: ATP-binding protein, partial [Leadbetterella sp.]|nr:ATP-binding protein [Leadbetterella sp.]